jgi:hypothetical protein
MTLTAQYIHGPQVAEILAKVTITVTDATGAVLERVYYSDAFGTPTLKDVSGTTVRGSTTGTKFLFTGRLRSSSRWQSSYEQLNDNPVGRLSSQSVPSRWSVQFWMAA